MELDFTPELESVDFMEYVKPIYDDRSACVVCLCCEEDATPWTRYLMPCGHVAHSRCFRRWTAKKNCLNCPFCGDLKLVSDNAFCDVCKKFGHDIKSHLNKKRGEKLTKINVKLICV